MNDRELLELAAKAAGWTWWRSKHGYWNLTSPEGNKHTACHNWSAYDPDTGEKRAEPAAADALRGFFDPEYDNEQAFKLMVKLRLDVLWAEHEKSVVVTNDSSNKEYIAEKVRFTDDPYAATRRAITRAAAEIGKAMK